MQLTSDLLFSPGKMKKDQSNNKGGFLQGWPGLGLSHEVNFRIFFSTIQTSRVYDGIQICSWVNEIYEN